MPEAANPINGSNAFRDPILWCDFVSSLWRFRYENGALDRTHECLPESLLGCRCQAYHCQEYQGEFHSTWPRITGPGESQPLPQPKELQSRASLCFVMYVNSIEPKPLPK